MWYHRALALGPASSEQQKQQWAFANTVRMQNTRIYPSSLLIYTCALNELLKKLKISFLFAPSKEHIFLGPPASVKVASSRQRKLSHPFSMPFSREIHFRSRRSKAGQSSLPLASSRLPRRSTLIFMDLRTGRYAFPFLIFFVMYANLKLI